MIYWNITAVFGLRSLHIIMTLIPCAAVQFSLFSCTLIVTVFMPHKGTHCYLQHSSCWIEMFDSVQTLTVWNLFRTIHERLTNNCIACFTASFMKIESTVVICRAYHVPIFKCRKILMYDVKKEWSCNC